MNLKHIFCRKLRGENARLRTEFDNLQQWLNFIRDERLYPLTDFEVMFLKTVLSMTEIETKMTLPQNKAFIRQLWRRLQEKFDYFGRRANQPTKEILSKPEPAAQK